MSKVNAFDTIRERHHAQARLLAAGRSPSEVASLIGASEAQLVRQISDPTFRELVSRYRAIDIAPNANFRFQTYSLAA